MGNVLLGFSFYAPNLLFEGAPKACSPEAEASRRRDQALVGAGEMLCPVEARRSVVPKHKAQFCRSPILRRKKNKNVSVGHFV